MARKEVIFLVFLQIMNVFGETEETPKWPKNCEVKDGETFHYVVIGAGSAGATLGTRLAELPDVNVLIIEAGEDPPYESTRPGLLGALLANREHDWNYFSEPETFSSRSLITPGVHWVSRAKMLGGCSSTNYMIYARGSPIDYDRWAADGFTTWNYKTLLKYFKKMQNLQDDEMDKANAEKYHSTSGPTIVTRPTRSSPLEENKFNVYLNIFEDIGIKEIYDYNGDNPFGVSRAFYTHSKAPNAIRSSTAQSYLVPNRNKANLHILKKAYVTKVLINDLKTAYGVEFIVNNMTKTVYVSNEVILSAGVFNSPKILMASGIGPKNQINDLGVKLVADLPVGVELTEHPFVEIYFTDSINQYANNFTTDINELSAALINAYFSLKDKTRPEYQIFGSYFFANLSSFEGTCRANRYQDRICQPGIDINKEKGIFRIMLLLLHPTSRGRVEIKSVDPTIQPVIYYGLLSNDSDVVTLRNGIKKVTELLNSRYMRKASSEIIKPIIPECDKFEFKSDDYWDCYIRNLNAPIFHPCCTCGMGRVVDEDLRVFNVKNLRVVDASAMRDLTSGNPNAPIIMMAEKIADNIKAGLKRPSNCQEKCSK